MTDSNSSPQQRTKRQRRRRPSALATWTVLAMIAFASSLTALAFAAGGALTLDSAANATLSEQVVVSAQGHTLYALSPETSSHLLCKSNQCLQVWPPLTVPSRSTKLKAGTGVHGTLSILRRANGKLQVTLRGMPLYRFSGDSAKGQANGQGIKSFGGTWHAVTASSSAPAAPSPPAKTPEYEY